MNKTHIKELVSVSLVPIFVLSYVFLHSYISSAAGSVAIAVLFIIQKALQNNENKKVTESGILKAMVVAPFIILIVSFLLIYLLYGVEQLNPVFGNNIIITLLSFLVLVIWLAQVFGALKYIKKVPNHSLSSDSGPRGDSRQGYDRNS
jgi:cytosine/uracil/thiamine/allantoin permease